MLKRIEISGFKSFAKKTALSFDTPITAIVGPNGSGKSNVVESIRFVLGEQSMKSLRGKGGSDLIWKGSKLLGGLSKARVTITFDNKNRQFAFSGSSGASAELQFDDVSITREVSADGGSTYFINGTSVRLKDLTEMLSSVHIGSSGHHIISQGEADRLLSSSSKDRRAMIEDALGLKVFQIRIKDSERKLEKTGLNMKEVQSLRRELAPHISFLAKQVEKIQKAEELRHEFDGLFRDYSQKEATAIATAEQAFSVEEGAVMRELSELEKTLSPRVGGVFEEERRNAFATLSSAESAQGTVRRAREELSRALSRIEGKLDALTAVQPVAGPSSIPAAHVENLCSDLLTMITAAQNSSVLETLQDSLHTLYQKVTSFKESLFTHAPHGDQENIRNEIEDERKALEQKLAELDTAVATAEGVVRDAREALAVVEQKIRDSEKNSYAGSIRKATLEGQVRELALRKEVLARRRAVLMDEIREAQILIAQTIEVQFVAGEADTPEAAVERENAHRRIERAKIKLEDAGAASGSEILKEYEDTKARDSFLVRELSDLEASMASLRELINELRDTIDRTFKEGIEKINTQFGEFFKLMFGGGSAFLSIVVEHRRKDDDMDIDNDSLPFEHGIEINVNLPNKKVRDLGMLSGGERSLVSIALLFAMSQVNPPPFLVLDETDAALDEANSRKYGDMLDLLSKHSKLIVVTHNRETMSRAQVLYGVTMGLEGASKLLSIKFDEAVLIAK